VRRRQWLRDWAIFTVVAVIFLAAVALVAYWERGWVCARWVHWATRFEANYGVRPDAVCAEYR